MTMINAHYTKPIRRPAIGERWGPYRVKALAGLYGVDLECPAGHVVRRTIDERNQVMTTKSCGQCRSVARAKKAAERVTAQPEQPRARRPYVMPVKPKRCSWCQGMSWGRPTDGAPCKCGEFYAPETMIVQAPTATSAMGEM